MIEKYGPNLTQSNPWMDTTHIYVWARHRLPSTLGLVTVSGCAPYAAVDVRRPSFPGRRLASLEQSATSCHVCTVTACFTQSSEDSSLQSQLSLTILSCLRSNTHHYGHVNRCSYLLTYLLTYIRGNVRIVIHL